MLRLARPISQAGDSSEFCGEARHGSPRTQFSGSDRPLKLGPLFESSGQELDSLPSDAMYGVLGYVRQCMPSCPQLNGQAKPKQEHSTFRDPVHRAVARVN